MTGARTLQLVLASNNPKKLAELQTLLAPAGIALVTQGSLGITEADEPHATFIENALAKARHAAHHAGGAAIADDSGLCVDALGGAPGVISAHFAAIGLPSFTDPTRAAGAAREAQRALQDAANNALLIERLHGAPDRRARFVSTLVAVRSSNDPEPLVAVGRWFGEILPSPRGMGGLFNLIQQAFQFMAYFIHLALNTPLCGRRSVEPQARVVAKVIQHARNAGTPQPVRRRLEQVDVALLAPAQRAVDKHVDGGP